MLIYIGDTSKRTLSRAINYLASHGRKGFGGNRFVSEDKLKEKGYPTDLLLDLQILNGTAYGYRSNGSNMLYYQINDEAIDRAKREPWITDEQRTN